MSKQTFADALALKWFGAASDADIKDEICILTTHKVTQYTRRWQL